MVNKRISGESVAVLLGWAGAALSIIGVVASLVAAFWNPSSLSFKTSPSASQQDVDDLRNQLDKQKKIIEDLTLKIAVQPTPTNETQIAQQINQLDTSVTKIKESTANLEKVILDDPAKAVSLPLIRKDLDNLKVSHQTELAAMQRDIERVYDLTKWLFGIMFTMALGVLSLAISNFWKTRKEERKTEV